MNDTDKSSVAAVTLHEASVDFDGRTVVTDASVTIRSGQITAIVGPNGAGKSTLLEAVAGTIALSRGVRAVTGSLAFVPQRAAISDRLPLSIGDVVKVGVWGRTGSWRRLDAPARASVRDALSRLNLESLASVPFGRASGGQQQRALLAQALAGGADVILVDEPTTALDAESALRIRCVLREESRRGAAVVCVTHDDAVIAEADRVIVMRDGRIAAVVEA